MWKRPVYCVIKKFPKLKTLLCRKALRCRSGKSKTRKLSSKPYFAITNIVFLIGGIYFAVLAIAGEATIYSLIPAVLCFISFGLSARLDLFFASPWRVATSVFILVLLIAQEIVAASAGFDVVTASSFLINGVLFIIFLGVALSVIREIAKTKSKEEEEEGLEEEEETSSV